MVLTKSLLTFAYFQSKPIMKTAGFVVLFLILQSSLLSQPANIIITGKVLDNNNTSLAYMQELVKSCKFEKSSIGCGKF
jgi:hypothetical protein